MEREELLNLIYENRNIIYSIAKRYPRADAEDLYQAGVLGFVKAYESFDKSLGVKFSTYAYKYILGEIKTCARRNNAIIISKDTTSLINQVNYMRESLTQEYMREPTTKEIADELGIEELRIIELLEVPRAVTSFDEPVCSDDGDMSLHEVISDGRYIDPNNIYDLEEELSSLPIEEQRFIHYRFIDEKPQREIANEFGISQVQVSRLEKRVLKKLRVRMTR